MQQLPRADQIRQTYVRFCKNLGKRTAFVHIKAHLSGRQHPPQLRYFRRFIMKNAYDRSVIDYFLNQLTKLKLEVRFGSRQALNDYQQLIEQCEDLEKKQKRLLIEKAFEDGVGEGMTDPERPFTGKEYFDVKYKK